ncbi:Rrf2 family transcriptional regulator [Carnobacteriaceae bacterium zg-ZUI78]|nr:Rrf2 family transcriptional regulator [Carnobacteriaceae bacterium zg-ZUI78]
MDTKFSVALHILTMISESKEVLSSQALATSVGTNASYIRKVIALLKNAGLLTSRQGKSGYELSKTAKEISLLEIYYATQEVNTISLFQIHQHANRECIVGKHIEKAMFPIFSDAERLLENQLSKQTLDDVIHNLYQEVGQNRI